MDHCGTHVGRNASSDEPEHKLHCEYLKNEDGVRHVNSLWRRWSHSILPLFALWTTVLHRIERAILVGHPEHDIRFNATQPFRAWVFMGFFLRSAKFLSKLLTALK